MDYVAKHALQQGIFTLVHSSMKTIAWIIFIFAEVKKKKKKKNVVITVTCPKQIGLVGRYLFIYFFKLKRICLVVIMLQKRDFIAIISVCR